MQLIRQSLPWGLALMIFLWLFTLVFDGLGLTRSRSHYKTYYGSLSWQHYRVTFQPVGSGMREASKGLAPTLRYGFNLANHVSLRAKVLQTDVPATDVAPLLYDTLRFPAGFSPDSVYYAWVEVRGHFLTYAFGARPGGEVCSYQAQAAPSAIPHYPPQPQLLLPLRLYAWATLLLPLWLGAALVALVLVPDQRDISSRLAPLLLIAAFAACRGYVDWLDYTTGGEWAIFGPLTILLLLGYYVYQLFQPAETDSAPEAGPVAGAG